MSGSDFSSPYASLMPADKLGLVFGSDASDEALFAQLKMGRELYRQLNSVGDVRDLEQRITHMITDWGFGDYAFVRLDALHRDHGHSVLVPKGLLSSYGGGEAFGSGLVLAGGAGDSGSKHAAMLHYFLSGLSAHQLNQFDGLYVLIVGIDATGCYIAPSGLPLGDRLLSICPPQQEGCNGACSVSAKAAATNGSGNGLGKAAGSAAGNGSGKPSGNGSANASGSGSADASGSGSADASGNGPNNGAAAGFCACLYQRALQQKVADKRQSIDWLATTIEGVGINKFGELFRAGEGDKAIRINPRPLRLLNTLAKYDVTLQEAAQLLHLSTDTVNKHVAAAKAALGTTTIAGTIWKAVQKGLIDGREGS